MEISISPYEIQVSPIGVVNTPHSVQPQILYNPPRPEDAPTDIRDAVLLGRNIFSNTKQNAADYTGNDLNCTNCHFSAGITPGGKDGGLSLVGVAAAYPKYRSRQNYAVDLITRTNDCFTRGQNGKPLPTDSKEMVAILTYYKWISTGVPIIDPQTGDLTFTPAANQIGTARLTATLRDSGGTYMGGEDTFSVPFTITVKNANARPEVSNIVKIGETGRKISFARADFSSHFNDPNHESLAKVKILTLPVYGKLQLNGEDVVPNQEIFAGQLSQLAFIPQAGWIGTCTFSWNGSDGIDYAETSATVTIRISASMEKVYLPMTHK